MDTGTGEGIGMGTEIAIKTEMRTGVGTRKEWQ